jgi:hypothetical protein
MSDLLPAPSGSFSDNSPETLTERIALRVMNARLAIEQGQGAHRDGTRRGAAPLNPDSTSEAERRETASLKRVFRELGVSYRRYRSQTGKPVLPELRAAAYRFRAAPSLVSLVAVAAYLDQLDLLN